MVVLMVPSFLAIEVFVNFVEVSSEFLVYEVAQGVPDRLGASAEQFGIYEFEEWWGGSRETAQTISFKDREGHPCIYTINGYGTLGIQAGSEPSEDGLAFWEAVWDQIGDKIRAAMKRQGY